MVVFLVIVVSWISTDLRHGPRRHPGRSRSAAEFFGVSLPWLAVVLVYIPAASAFRLSGSPAADRERANAPAFQVSGDRGVLTTRSCGGWHLAAGSYDVSQVVALYFLVGASIFAILDGRRLLRSEYAEGIIMRHQARSETHPLPGIDLSLNRRVPGDSGVGYRARDGHDLSGERRSPRPWPCHQGERSAITRWGSRFACWSSPTSAWLCSISCCDSARAARCIFGLFFVHGLGCYPWSAGLLCSCRRRCR